MDKWDESYQKGEGLRWWPETEFVRFLGTRYPSRTFAYRETVLELGAGTGRNLWACYDKGLTCYGIDGSLDALCLADDYLRSRLILEESVVLKHAILPRIPCEASHFDLVVDCQTVQHLSDEAHTSMAQEIVRVLKPGGYFWSMHYKSGDAKQIYAGRYPELHDWSMAKLTDCFGPVGLRNESAELVMRTYKNGQQVLYWLITVWRKP